MDCACSIVGVSTVRNRQRCGAQLCLSVPRALSHGGVLTYSISCCWLACLDRLNVRPPVNISVTFAVLATLLNQRAGRKALIREASSVVRKPLLG